MKVLNLSAAAADTIYIAPAQLGDIFVFKVPHNYTGVCTLYDASGADGLTLTAGGVSGIEMHSLGNLNRLKYKSSTTGVCLEVLLP